MLKWAEDGMLTVFGNRLVFTASHLINMKLFDGFVMDRGVALCKAIDAGGQAGGRQPKICHHSFYQNLITTVPTLLWYVKCGHLLKSKPVHGNKGPLKAACVNCPSFLCVGMVWVHPS